MAPRFTFNGTQGCGSSSLNLLAQEVARFGARFINGRPTEMPPYSSFVPFMLLDYR